MQNHSTAPNGSKFQSYDEPYRVNSISKEMYSRQTQWNKPKILIDADDKISNASKTLFLS